MAPLIVEISYFHPGIVVWRNLPTGRQGLCHGSKLIMRRSPLAGDAAKSKERGDALFR